MSKLYFHTQNKTVSVAGAERKRIQLQIQSLCSTMLMYPESGDEYPLLDMLEPDIVDGLMQVWQRQGFTRFWQSLNTILFSQISDRYLLIGQHKFDWLSITLNTALRQNVDAFKFMARIDGQCEIHLYCEAKDKLWLANLIEAGIRDFDLAKDVGWTDVVALLNNSGDSPIVTSHSSREQFPNSGIANLTEDWYKLPQTERWETAMMGLRHANTTKQLRLDPEAWEDYYFGHGLDILKVNYLIKLSRPKRELLIKKYIDLQLPAFEAWEYAKRQ